MQQLQVKFNHTPTDTSLVCSSVSPALNKDQSPSVQDKVLACNNLEGNLLPHTGGQNLKVSANVYVLDMNGNPVMPTSPMKARKLLKTGKAKVVKRVPFTIQMLYLRGSNKQDIVLGIDSGYNKIGFSCNSPKKVVMWGEVELDNKTKERLSEKRMYRRGRRNRLWYREPRFNNRRRKEGWLPPSTQRRYDTHISLIKRIKKILPITKIIVEVGNFDIQKIENPGICGKGYQQGNLYNYQNMRSYLISREKGKCQFCGKEKGNYNWHIHHINSRMTGSNSSDNLSLLHSKCHKKMHKNKLEGTIKNNKTYKEATFMNIIKRKLQEELGCEITYGYITFINRNKTGLEKTHYNDAFVIAGGKNQIKCLPILVNQKRKNNRSLQLNRKGYARSIRKQRYKYQPKDLVWVNNKKYEVIGTHSYGKCIKVKNRNDIKPLNFPIKNIKKHYMNNSLIF